MLYAAIWSGINYQYSVQIYNQKKSHVKEKLLNKAKFNENIITHFLNDSNEVSKKIVNQLINVSFDARTKSIDQQLNNFPYKDVSFELYTKDLTNNELQLVANSSNIKRDELKRDEFLRWLSAIEKSVQKRDFYVSTLKNNFEKIFFVKMQGDKKSSLSNISVLSIPLTSLKSNLDLSQLSQFIIIFDNQILIAIPEGKNLTHREKTIDQINNLGKFANKVTFYNEKSKDKASLTSAPVTQNLLKLNYEIKFSNLKETLKFQFKTNAIWFLAILLISALIFFPYFDKSTRSINEMKSVIKNISEGHFNQRVQIKTTDDLGTLANYINIMSAKLHFMYKKLIDKTKFKFDQEIKESLAKFIPLNTTFKSHHLNISHFYKSESKYGGDIWGHIEINEHLELIFIGDSMGRGTEAALMSTIVFSEISSMIEDFKYSKRTTIYPSQILEKLNKLIMKLFKGKQSITLFLSIFDFRNRVITFSNAGHHYPLLLPAQENSEESRSFSRISNLNTQLLSQKSTPVGLDSNTVYTDKDLPINKHDKVVFYTDGLLPIKRHNGLTRKKVSSILTYNSSLDNKEIINHILNEYKKSLNAKDNLDDLTVLISEIQNLDYTIPQNSHGNMKNIPIPTALNTKLTNSATVPAGFLSKKTSFIEQLNLNKTNKKSSIKIKKDI